MMASLIKTRGADQCRSHHQKMQKKYDTIQNILVHCRRTLPRLKKKKNDCLKKKSTSISETIKVNSVEERSVSEASLP